MKIRIKKRLMIGLALVFVFVGGAFINASAECVGCRLPAQATCQGAYQFGPTTPTPFGVGGAAGG